ncbi:maltose ABC transporter permease MalF [Limnochorda pilosa]|uniref:Maltose/maltodextrin transport system permease protein n=1 Tax=Limnochorda pilosa TaxID=1555112 RepID=A0A0K2SIW6_LIMPI|nr:maltose ABC transporter permease MalF [Limnochorda pilosa]BAS27048.1 maltose ABC transporter permease [Limnochorda pilosa]
MGVLLIGLLDVAGAWFASQFYLDGAWAPALAILVGIIGTTWVYTSSRTYPLRYIWPGLIFFILLVVYPIGYTVYLAFTNTGSGHLLSKEQVIRQFEETVYTPQGARRFPFTAFQSPSGEITFVLYVDEGRPLLLEDGKARPVDPDADRALDTDGDGRIDRWGDAEPLAMGALARQLSRLQAVLFEWNDAFLRLASLKEFAEVRPAYRYDADADVLTDLRTGKAYRPVGGSLTDEEGKKLEPGFVEYVGLANFVRLFTDPAVSGPFLRVFLWTFAWAALTVVLQSVVGMSLALLLNDPYLKLRNFHRSILILPYAVPAFISILVWNGLLNTEMGAVNDMLNWLGLPRIPWMQDAFWARVGLLLVNTWLGYPYMMLVTLGALQSIPSELYEAAVVDGASPWGVVRVVTLPLLMISIAPLLVASFATNFNNFNVIFLLTGGGPPIAGAETPAGHTDILISYAYRLAFQGGQGTQFSFAAAISLIIFLIVAVLTLINFRMTRAFEEVSENV